MPSVTDEISNENHFPPDPSVIENEFDDARRESETFEDIRWLVWLYDALENENWKDAQWRGSVLSSKGYRSLIQSVDGHYGEWLNQAAKEEK